MKNDLRIKRTFGFVSVFKGSKCIYMLEVPNLRDYEIKAFESGLLAFARSFSNICKNNRLQQRFRGVACKN